MLDCCCRAYAAMLCASWRMRSGRGPLHEEFGEMTTGNLLEAGVLDLFECGRILRQIDRHVPHSQFGKLLFGGLALRIVRIGEDGHGHSFPPYANRLPLVWKILSATFFDFARLLGPFISIHYP